MIRYASFIVIFAIITVIFIGHCYSYVPTISANIDNGSDNVLYSSNGSFIYAWKADKTLAFGWPKSVTDADIHSCETTEELSSRFGPDLIIADGTTSFEYGVFHHLRRPVVKSFSVSSEAAANGSVINILIDPLIEYSYTLDIKDRDNSMIERLSRSESTLQTDLSAKWATKSITPETYFAVLDIRSDFAEEFTASISFEVTDGQLTDKLSDEPIASSETTPSHIENMAVQPAIFYPNTSKGTARLSYRIAGKGPLTRTVTVTNSSGSDTKTLCQNERCYAGEYSDIWYGDCANMASDSNNDGFADEGTYFFSVELRDPYGNSTNESVMVSIADKPKLEFISCPSCFSPNNDGLNDTLALKYSLGLSKLVDNSAAVEINIIDGNGTLIFKRSETRQAGIDSFVQDGNGLPDGNYSVRISAKDALGNDADAISGNFMVDRGYPAVTIEGTSFMFDPYIDPLEFTYYLGDDTADTLTSSISVYRGSELIRQISRTLTLSCKLTYSDKWDGKNDGGNYLNEGSYRLVVIATDEAMNTSSASRGVMISDDRRLTSSSAEAARPYINNWLEGSGNYKLIAQARSSSNNFVTFYLPKRQTIKAVTYNTSGAAEKKRCALFDNFRQKVIFDHNQSGIYYYDLPEGSYTALADFTRWSNIPEAVVDIYAVDENDITDYYSGIFNICYIGREFLTHRTIDSSAFAGFMGQDNDEDYFTVNDNTVNARIRTEADGSISSQHQIFKFGKASDINSIYVSTRAKGTSHMTLRKGLYMTWVRASASWLAGWARTIVDFDERKYDEYSVTSNDSGRNWLAPTGPVQTVYDHYPCNILGYWGRSGSIAHKVEAVNGQLYYSRGTIINEGSCSAPQLLNNEYVPPSSITEPQITWSDPVQITFKAVDPKDPSICDDSVGNVFCAWIDSRNGKREVYYQKIPLNFEPVGSRRHLSQVNSIKQHPPILIDPTSEAATLLFSNKKFEISGVLNYPNPFKQTTKIRYDLSRPADSVEIRIYSLRGALIKELCGTTASGHNDVEWYGRDRNGKACANGAYVFEVTARRNGIAVRGIGKIVVLK